MVEWLAGNRIQGTSTERTVGTPEVPAVSGGWKEVARTTLGSAGDVLNVSSIPDKRYYMVLSDFQDSGNIQPALRLGNSSLDSSANYRERWSTNGGSDVTQSNTYHVQWVDVTGKTKPIFGVNYIANKSGKEKLGISHIMNNGGNGAGNAPARQESVFKWTGTSLMDILGYNNLGNGDFDTDSEVVILGYDPDDTHTTNFWEPLADINATGSQSSFDTGTFTAKKYLWIQFYWKATFTGAYTTMRVGNTTLDSGSNYAWRWSNNGGSDSTGVNKSDGWYPVSGQGSDSATDYYVFGNMFMVNNASNEKLGICHTNRWDGAGATNANARSEVAVKWANTTNQIDIVGLERAGGGASGNYDTESFIKVWGSD
jgi:hypothetical protein